MQPKHSAIVAGLTLALSFGAVSAPAPAAAEEPTPGVASDATDIDKGLYIHPAVLLGRAEVGPGCLVCQRDSRDEVLYQVREPWQLQPGLFVR